MDYPWGKKAPRYQLKQTCARVQQALAATNEPDYAGIGARLEGVVQATKPLAVALRHVASVGLRPVIGEDTQEGPVLSEDIERSLQALDAAVGTLAQASVQSVSKDYAGFAAAAKAVIESAEQAVKRGVEKRSADTVTAAWNRFGA